MAFVQLIIFHRVCKCVWHGSSVCWQDAACPVSAAGIGREPAHTGSGPHSVRGRRLRKERWALSQSHSSYLPAPQGLCRRSMPPASHGGGFCCKGLTHVVSHSPGQHGLKHFKSHLGTGRLGLSCGVFSPGHLQFSFHLERNVLFLGTSYSTSKNGFMLPLIMSAVCHGGGGHQGGGN